MTNEDKSVMDAPVQLPLPAEITGLRSIAVLAILAGGICLLVALFSGDLPQIARAYLFAWLFCLGLSLGSMAIVMLGHLVSGEWGWVVRRFAEAAAANIPLLAVLYIPIALTFRFSYPWAVPSVVAHDEILQSRMPYMQPMWVIFRAVIYFAIWTIWSTGLRSCSANFDRTGDLKYLVRARKFSASGFPLYMVTMTLAAIDWIMTLDAHWFSHIIGFVTAVGQAGSAVALMIYLLTRVVHLDPFKKYVQPRHLNDLGNLLLTLMILWAYMSFAQMLIIWMGNAQDDNMYYVQRGFGSTPNLWRWVAMLLLIGHFLVPFFALLIRGNKRQPLLLGRLALLVIVMRCIDVYWWIIPAPPPAIGHPGDGLAGRASWVDPCAVLLLVGIWMTMYLRNLAQRPLLARLGVPLSVDRGHGHSHKITNGHTGGTHGTEHALGSTSNPSLA